MSMSSGRLAEIQYRWEAAPMGPWKVYEEELTYNELAEKDLSGKVVGMPAGPEYSIGTAWDHPQLKAPSPIIGLWFSPYYEGRSAGLNMSPSTAEFVAASWQDVKELCEEVERLRGIIKAAADGAYGEELRSHLILEELLDT